MNAIPLPYLTKPTYGSPCNGCGLCCAVSLCEVAVTLFGYDQIAPCPALEYRDGRSWCGVVLVETQFVEANPATVAMIHHGLGIGEGCGMEDAKTIEEMLELS